MDKRPIEKRRCLGNSPYCLGLPEWDCCGTQGLLERVQSKEADGINPTSKSVRTANDGDSTKPMAKKQKYSLQLHKEKKKVLSPSSRLNTTVSNEEVHKSSKGCIPKNTSHSTSWAVCVYKKWVEQCNKRMDVAYPTDIFEKNHDTKIICDCSQHFISEVRRADGTEYPPKILYQSLCGLLRYAREQQTDPVNF